MVRRAGIHALRPAVLDGMPLRMLVLAAFFICGALFGYFFSLRCCASVGGELERYLESYFSLSAQRGFSLRAFFQTLGCYFRVPAILFFLGFSSIGLALIPLLLSLQGFLLSFSVCCIAFALGAQGFGFLIVFFLLRVLVLLPCSLLLGAHALEKAQDLALLTLGNGKRARAVRYGASYWYRFGLCCVCLFLSAFLELWLIPRLLPLFAA